VRLVTRNGADKREQFPELVAALKALVVKTDRLLVLDGEIVALDEKGHPSRFQDLQSRVHLKNAKSIAKRAAESPAALVIFDILRDGSDVLIDLPWVERRKRLVSRLRGRLPKGLLLAPSEPDGKAMLALARREGWEGIMMKRMDSPYTPGERSEAWKKLKIEKRQEFVVGGFTAPRNTREHIGALLLGYYDPDGRFVYAGHTGGGFTREGLADMRDRLAPLVRKTMPFTNEPHTNEEAQWVKPQVVVEVKFNEWTSDGRLRQPIFVGVRDDKDARDVVREE
jgi:bifunctional non-homologous end joining protein LigD